MITFIIVSLAVICLVTSRIEHARPRVLTAVATICLLLGGRSTTVLSDSAFWPALSALAAAESSDSEEPLHTDSEEPEEREAADQVLDSVESKSDVSDFEPAVGDSAEGVMIDDSESMRLGPVVPVEYPDRGEDAPAWLEAERWTDNEADFVAVQSKLHFTRKECSRALAEQVKEATDEYINRLLNSSRAAMLIGYSIDEIERHNLIEEQFDEQVMVTSGPMRQSHALLRFSDSIRNDIEERWRKLTATTRLMQTGLGAGAVFMFLGALFGYFKLDTATRGYYTGRLQFATAGTILALVAASFLASKWITWM